MAQALVSGNMDLNLRSPGGLILTPNIGLTTKKGSSTAALEIACPGKLESTFGVPQKWRLPFRTSSTGQTLFWGGNWPHPCWLTSNRPTNFIQTNHKPMRLACTSVRSCCSRQNSTHGIVTGLPGKAAALVNSLTQWMAQTKQQQLRWFTTNTESSQKV